MRQLESVVDPEYCVSKLSWVLSLVVKEFGKNPEHAILLVEGLSQSDAEKQYTFRRYDFVIKLSEDKRQHGAKHFDKNMLKRRPGNIVIKAVESRPFKEQVNGKIGDEKRQDERCGYFWNQFMVAQDGCKGISWNITADQAKQLHANVLKDQENPPDYQISGEHAFIPKSSGTSGKNCYTWARGQLMKLRDERIDSDDRLRPTISDLFAARTSCHVCKPVVEELEPTTHGCVIS